MQTGLENLRELRRGDRKKLNRRIAVMFIAVIGLFLAMCCMRTTVIGFIYPVTAVKNIFAMLRVTLVELFGWGSLSAADIISGHSYYYETVGMFKSALLVIVTGAVLSMAGGVVQCVFRNPIATASMLGVSSSVNIVNMILVITYSSSIYQMIQMRYVLSYAVSLGSLLIIYIISRLMGGKKSSVTDMLLVGTVFMRIVQNFVQVYQYYYMTEDDYLILEELNTYGTTAYETQTLLVMYGLLLVCVLILSSMRFSLNAISFDDDDSRTLGIRADRLRLIALVCAVMMESVAQVNYGNIGMLSLLIPHVCRYWLGSDFRVVLLGSAGLGAVTLLVCRLIMYLMSFNYYLSLISMGSIISVITTPLLIIVLLQQKRGWT
ncbi:MAG: iron ABC transporter permease [Oscillospiraceae bacterium]|nr:iron ABC transporter permease [Oscillospiraceae bacterium]